jgi:hypothetical protein
VNTLNSIEPTADAKQPKGADQTSSASRPRTTKGKAKSSKMSLDSGSAEKSLKKIPVPNKHNDHNLRDQRTIEARKRIGVTPQLMSGVPKISHLLGCAEGGVDGCISALRLSDDPDAVKFLERFDAISASDRTRLTIEEIATSAGISTKNLLAATLLAVEYLGTSAARMATASFSAPVIQATAQAAINGKNPTANRKLFLSGSGFLPRPANREPGVFVNITNQNAAAARAMHEASEAPPAPIIEATPSTPYINTEDQLRALHDVHDGQRLLDAPRELGEAVEIGGTFIDDELDCIPSGDVR